MGRRPTLRAVVLGLIGALALVVLLAPRHSPRSATPARPPDRGEVEAQLPRLPVAAQSSAERFVKAFVAYGTGRLDPRTRRQLAGSTSPALYRELVARPPRIPAATKPPSARIESVTLRARSTSGLADAKAAVRYDGQAPVSLSFELREAAAGRWAVTVLYPQG